MVFVAGHFGEWIQGLVGGSLALVTLDCRDRGVRATWQDAPQLALDDPAGLIGTPRAKALLEAVGVAPRGKITIAPDLPPGGGAGMSTAALVALARAAGGDEARCAAACLSVEGAVDPLMLDTPDSVLWAPRSATALAPLPPPPRATILGGFWGAPYRTDPGDHDFPPVDDLIAEWSQGPHLSEAARLASLSASRTTARRGPGDDPTEGLAQRLGALGWARAHTGSARALIFAPGTLPETAGAAMRAAGYDHVMHFETGGRT
ncbi:propanediol utilization protein [Roseicyclus marinus]|uniref:propanediol utilization protein n=1 Tax=Roseicyclus marinus TaxID=2161673 RepID=UPI00241071EE|nr:propanediol utilization protein [Roseicyclus marinus]MDG3039749.1 propanediol utilization protein [Roseicyclus marinus]